MRVVACVGVVSAGLASVGVAAAADCNDKTRLGTCIDADTFWPHAGAGRLQSVGATETTAASQISFGVVTTYLRKPIVLRDTAPGSDGVEVPAIDHLFDATFLWAFGVTDRLETTLAMPVTVYQTGTGVSAFSSAHAKALPETAMRDARFGFAYALLPRPRVLHAPGGALTGRFEIGAPTGEEASFAGDRGSVWIPSLAADYRYRRMFVAAELGARLRGTTQLAGTRVGSQGFAALGVGMDILGSELLSAALEAYALPSLVGQEMLVRDAGTGMWVAQSSSRRWVPGEWMLTARSAPVAGGDFSFSLSLGGGLPLTDPMSMTTPQLRIVAGLRYAPLARDTDGDGVPDRDDLCPSDKEDRDGFEDDDGCPDPDNDRDGIPDEIDRCRDSPEDHDGFQDEDGCPDLDDDGDGIPDTKDQCRFAPEDRDGFQDEDGCPDLDNDMDGIPDTEDRCPNAPEDLDGYQDQDGCPDPDNDMDGIPDIRDKCPNGREDKDGFQDEDGCPDPDNDVDGVPDELDRCPLEPETINGVDDEDGCPEPGAVDLTQVKDGKVSVVNPVAFAPNQAKVTAPMRAQLRMIAQRARSVVPVERVIIEAFADVAGESPRNAALATGRADAIRAVMVESGLPANVVTAAVGDLTVKRPAAAPQYEIVVVRGTFK